ncbi:MAG: aminotransferase class V-fold PLP-dependent enzyme [Bacteroidota bacterium]
MRNDLKIFNEIVEVLLQEEEKTPVVKPIPATELFDTLDLDLNEDPMIDEAFKDSLQKLILHTPRTATKLFFNQLFGGRSGRAMIGELLAAMMNNSMYTYKVGGPMIGVEKVIVNRLLKMINYPESAGGTFTAGGSMSNFMGMLMARDAFDHTARFHGVPQGMIAYTSKESHYSVQKNAAFIGMGRNNIRYVPADDSGGMIPGALDEMIQADKEAGLKPFMVNATSGTTVLGAFDPIRAISAVCKNHQLWLHVDGAFGGSALFSKKWEHLMDGVELSDSFCINAHKMLGPPMACSMIFARDQKHLYDSFANEASYLYQTHDDGFNPGKISFNCGRRNDALKFWTLWKSVGTKGLEQIVDHEFHLAKVAKEYVKNHPDYTVYGPDNSVSICFNYKDLDPKALCNSLYEAGEIMVGYGSFRSDRFVRLVTVNSGNSEADLMHFFKKLEAFAAKHEEELSVKVSS